MADSFIQLPADSTGKKVDTRTESTNSEHREIHVVGDPSSNEAVSVVTNVDPSGEIYGLVVRDPNTSIIASRLTYGATTGNGTSSGALRAMLASDAIMSTLTVTDNIANQDLPGVASFMVGYDGSTWDRAQLSNQGPGETQTNTLRVVQAVDAISSTQISGISRTTNPTAISDGSNVRASFDDLGRQLIRPVQVRDLLYTASLTKSTGSTFGTETTFRSASAGEFLDLVYLTATNDSNVSANVDLRSVTAGNILLSFTIPTSAGGGQITIQPPVPIPQDATGNNWTIDCADITGTNLRFFGLFSREV